MLGGSGKDRGCSGAPGGTGDARGLWEGQRMLWGLWEGPGMLWGLRQPQYHPGCGSAPHEGVSLPEGCKTQIRVTPVAAPTGTL